MSAHGRVAIGVLGAVVLIGVGTAGAFEIGEGRLVPARPSPRAPARPAVRHTSPTPRRRHRVALGSSVRHRLIWAEEIGDLSSPGPLLVVGCIHGNEGAGIAIAKDLLSDPPPRDEALWVIPDLNPDGFAAGTRQNARGVDLNRNFPWRWRPLGRRGDLTYSGPRPLSEPESRLARQFILRRRPVISIWFHQHADLVDESGGRVAVERRYARLTGLPLRRLPRYPGSAVGWENHVLRHGTAFVVELPPGRLSPRAVERFSDAILKLI